MGVTGDKAEMRVSRSYPVRLGLRARARAGAGAGGPALRRAPAAARPRPRRAAAPPSPPDTRSRLPTSPLYTVNDFLTMTRYYTYPDRLHLLIAYATPYIKNSKNKFYHWNRLHIYRTISNNLIMSSYLGRTETVVTVYGNKRSKQSVLEGN